MTTHSAPWPHPRAPHRPTGAGRWTAAAARRLAALWQRLTEDEDARFLRGAHDLQELEQRLRVLERGRRDRVLMAPRGPYG
jgi:hypothetical protein